ncbi:restriction endonuclease subunit S [Streptococcus pseudopneumoniae]|uniref:restriction endonuclease subunit S n=1 Tax=Streptococcus pseudopneumoniae TaxID=257758 RepID=UPI0018B094F3|nr:restriction endonuclease subunit S [Streptococcus pseudopneumoniae]MBF9617946.1 restriction endonuclease subunit S [Streptococcus pseudopneumoniae]
MIKQPSYRFVGFEDEWKEVKVSDIFRVTRGQVLATTQISEEKTDTYKYPVYSSQTKNEGLLGYYDKYLFETAITWTTDGANAGTVNYREGKFYSTNVNGVLLSDEGFANKVIAEILNNEAWKYVSKVGNPKLMNNVMSEISLVIPNDFREISILSTFFQDIDQLISLQQRKLEVLKEQKKTYLKLLFSAKGQTKPALRFAGFEDDWKEVKLGDLILRGGSGGTPKSTVAKYYGGDIPFLSITDISNSGKYLKRTEKTITNEGLQNSSAWVVPEGAISLAMYASVGKLAILGIDCATSQAFYNMVFEDDIVRNFVYITLEKANIYNEWGSLISTGTQANLNAEKVKNFSFLHPSKPEQEVIGSFFQDLDKAIAKQEEKVNQLKESKQTLLRKMFI